MMQTVRIVFHMTTTSYESMTGAMERRIEARVDWSGIVEIKTLGLDEIALKKGHRDYVTLVTGRLSDGEIVILGVLPGHEKADVIDFLRSIPLRIIQTIQIFSDTPHANKKI
jgi:transposase